MSEREILERVRAGGLLVAGQGVIVLLSGGRDSVCLLEIALRIVGRADLRALHVNYGLRDQSDGDERHCVELCGRLGVPIDVERPSARPERGNVQAWAREIRYGAATRIARRTGADVAAGHTATDQVEGVLYRLASAPSRRALLGMRERNGMLVRPLLELTREETGVYCRERGLDWRDDATNSERTYTRGRVRGELVPALRAIHPAAQANVLALVEILRDEAAVLDSLLDDVLQARREIELTRLRELPAALRRLVVQHLADVAAGRPAPGIAAPTTWRRSASRARHRSISGPASAPSPNTGCCASSSRPGRRPFRRRFAWRSPGASTSVPSRFAARSDRQSVVRVVSIARRSGPSCSCARGVPATEWRRSGSAAPRASRICSPPGGSRARGG